MPRANFHVNAMPKQKHIKNTNKESRAKSNNNSINNASSFILIILAFIVSSLVTRHIYMICYICNWLLFMPKKRGWINQPKEI